MKKCPCHSDLSYSECCKKLHDGAPASDALALMRSRYSAYALGLVQYIIDTTHKNNPSYSKNVPVWKKELKAFCANTHFNNLIIVYFEPGDTIAYVSFIAQLTQNGNSCELIEKSMFKKEGKRWLYLEGTLYSTPSELPHYKHS